MTYHGYECLLHCNLQVRGEQRAIQHVAQLDLMQTHCQKRMRRNTYLQKSMRRRIHHMDSTLKTFCTYPSPNRSTFSFAGRFTASRFLLSCISNKSCSGPPSWSPTFNGPVLCVLGKGFGLCSYVISSMVIQSSLSKGQRWRSDERAPMKEPRGTCRSWGMNFEMALERG